MSQNGLQYTSNHLINDSSFSTDISGYPDTAPDLSSLQNPPEFPESDYPEELLEFLGISETEQQQQPQPDGGYFENQNQVSYLDLNSTGSFASLEQEIMSNLSFNGPTVSNSFSAAVRPEVVSNMLTHCDITSVPNQILLPQLGNGAVLARESSTERELLNFLTLESTSGSAANQSLNFQDPQTFPPILQECTNGFALSTCQKSDLVIRVGPVSVIQTGYQEDPLPNAAIGTLITDENIEETLQVETLSTKKFLRLFWFLILSD